MSHFEPNIDTLKLCISLAKEALEAGDDPFGSVLVDSNGRILQQDRNRVLTGKNGDGKADATLHPELALAVWAQYNLEPEERAQTTMYTSGEHCAMCSAAHAYCGLGRIVYISSTAQYQTWLIEFGRGSGKLRPLAINDVAPAIQVQGPIVGLDEEVKELHRQKILGSKGASS
ncbi:cytidine deaminase-like protein [Dactylonectria estremocensis]|uniref:Cytidine deaminase-like protein n=1 Tax=Dactylonectria estremocensis TaxID=1079267 RepID=A0A9P9JG93_9HYPO|nr:cytidine deaminase-like protein [Dactylonectria estremocensis]